MIVYKVNGEMLSPVHIGTGQNWEPLEYYIDSKKHLLYRFSTENILTQLDEEDRKKFYELLEIENLNSLKSFIIERAKQLTSPNSNPPIPVTSTIGQLYDDKINDIGNQLLIQPMIRLPETNVPYLPGSSLKGAIRTAVISQLAQKSDLEPPKPFGKEAWRFEHKVLNSRDAKQDPFRALKLTDAKFSDSPTFICQLFNIRKNNEDAIDQTSIQLIYEVTHSKISSQLYQRKCNFEAELRLDDALMNQKNAVSQKLSVDQILESCNLFYRDKLKMEYDKFYQGTSLAKYSEQLLDDPISENECLIRVGRFSGVESVTLDKYRNPQPPGRRGWGGTRNIADGRFPMGWIKIKLNRIKN